MTLIRNIIISFFVLLFFFSCTGGKKLANSLTKYPIPLNQRNNFETNDNNNISLNLVNSIDSISYIKPKKRFVIPLLVFTLSHANVDVTIGQDILDDDYSTYFKESLISKIESDSNNNEIMVEVSFDTIFAHSTYHRHRTTFYPIVICIDNFKEFGYGANVIISAKTKIYKKGELIGEKKYFNVVNQQFTNKSKPEQNKSQFRYDFMKNISYALANCTEKITSDIAVDIKSLTQ